MKVGDLVRMRISNKKRTFCVLWFTESSVSMQSMDEERLLITMPRTKIGGLKRGE